MGVLIAVVRWVLSLALMCAAALLGYVGFYAEDGNWWLVAGGAGLLMAAFVVNPLTIAVFGLRGRPMLAWLAVLVLLGAGVGLGGYGAWRFLESVAGEPADGPPPRSAHDVAYAIGEVMNLGAPEHAPGDVSAVVVLSRDLATRLGVGECHIGLLRLLGYHIETRSRFATAEERAAVLQAARYQLSENGQMLGEQPLPDEATVRMAAAAWFGAAISALPDSEAMPLHIPHSIVERARRRLAEQVTPEDALPALAGSVQTQCLAPLDFWR
ncbi:MAG: hypothetical protein AB7O98_02160 [Hyphomonadaceae bacterium]